MAAQFFVNGALTASFAARAPQLRDRIGVSIEGYGLLLTGAAVFGLVSSACAGPIIHNIGTKRVLQGGGVITVSALAIIGFARSPWVWLLGMVLYGVVDVLVDISMNLQGSWISDRRHTGVMNRLHGTWSLGTFAGGLGAVAANAVHVSPATHLAIVAVLMAVVVAVLTRHLLPNDEEEAHAAPIDDSGVAPRLRILPVVLLMAAGAFAVVNEITGGDWATFRMTDDFHAAAALGSAAFVAFTIGMTAMRFAGDTLQYRFGRARLHRACVLLAIVGFACATLVPVEAIVVAGFCLAGVGVATFMPKLYDDAARMPGRRGAGVGALRAGLTVAFLGAPAAIGALAGSSLSVGSALAIFSLPAAVGLLLVSSFAPSGS